MSYDVSISAPIGVDGKLEDIGYWSNYTSNMTLMWKEAGLNLRDLDGMICKEAASILRKSIDHLRDNPVEMKKYNPSNGWGDYEGGLTFLEGLLSNCEKFPKCVVEVY